MNKVGALTTLAILILLSLLSVGKAQVAAPSCHNDESWTFKVEGKNPVVSRSDEVNGIYTIKCQGEKPVFQGHYPNHFAAVVPSVPGLTAEPPWFNFLNGQTEWSWEFEWEPPGLNKPRKEKWKASFTAKQIDDNTTEVIRKDEGLKLGGWRNYKYLFSKKIGGVTTMAAEWKNGTTYRSELIEHKSGERKDIN